MMGRHVLLDDEYYAEQSHDAAPWMIRDKEHRVIGHYSVKTGASWGDTLNPADKDWLTNLVQKKLT